MKLPSSITHVMKGGGSYPLFIRRREGPDDHRLDPAGVAVAVRGGALETEAVALPEQEPPGADGDLEAAGQHDSGLLAAIADGRLAALGAGCERRIEQLELSRKRGREQVIRDSQAEVQLPPAAGADDELELLGRPLLAPIEEPAHMNAQRRSDFLQIGDGGRRAVALHLADIAR